MTPMTLALGAMEMSVLIGSIVFAVVGAGRQGSAHYAITKEGILCKVVHRPGAPAEISTFEGALLNDPETGRVMSLPKFDSLVAKEVSLNVDFGDQSRMRNHLEPSTRFFSLLRIADRVFWYWSRKGRLMGYDAITKRLVGTIEPAGFLRSENRFLRASEEVDEDSEGASHVAEELPIMATPSAVYRIDLKGRTATHFFSPEQGDPVGAAGKLGSETVVVTMKFIRILDAKGIPLLAVPYEPVDSEAMWLKVSVLESSRHYAFWLGRYLPRNNDNRAQRKRYSRVMWISEQGLLRVEELPPVLLSKSQALATLSYRLNSLLLPPLPIVQTLMGWELQPFALGCSLGMAVACGCAAWFLGRRTHVTTRTHFGWLIFHLFLGLPGFLAFLSVREPSARETCPGCRRLRILERERCEHCGAEFLPAGRTGTEILGPAPTSSK